MTTRQTSKLAPVGSISWIANERLAIRQLEDQDVEDFSFSARNDLEWLNEHMADIFERKTFDMAEILKTPGRLRGKTPRTARKQTKAGEREPLADVFFNNNRATPSTSAPQNKFYDAISQSATKKDRPAQPLPRSRSHSPAKSPQRQQSPKPSNNRNIQPPTDQSAEPSLPAPSFADSGFFTSSNPNSQLTDPVQPEEKPSHKRQQSGSSQVFVDAPSGTAERDSFRTAEEDTSSAVLSQAREARTEADIKEIEETIISEGPSPKKVSALKDSPKEPRRSGRLARPSDDAQIIHVEEISHKDSEPSVSMVEAPKETEAIATDAPIYPNLSDVKSQEEIEPEFKSPERDSRSESPESPIPDVPLVRKSSLNFASLPAREPLTNKKKSLGAKVVRDSHVEQVRLNGASRASWMNRKGGNGKSLGASSSAIASTNNATEENEESSIQAPGRGQKRRSQGASSQWQKKQKVEDDKVIDPVEEIGETVKVPTKGIDEDSDGETQRNLAQHNKSSTQRLHDKIQQLGKTNAARTARSFPAPVPQSTASYPDLSHSQPLENAIVESERPVDDVSKKPLGATVQITEEAQDELIFKKTHRPQLSRSRTEETERIRNKFEQLESAKSPKMSSPKRKPPPAKIWSPPPYSRAPNTTDAIFSPGKAALATLNSPKRQGTPVPSSPRKDVIHPESIDTSDLPLRTPSSPKSPVGGAISAAKAQTASMLKKAREMWMKSSVVSASAKAEILSPPLGNVQDEDPILQVVGSPRPRALKKEQEESLYPDLQSVFTKPKEGSFVFEDKHNAAPIVDKVKGGRETRNSRSREASIAKSTQPIDPPERRETRLSKSRETKAREDDVPQPQSMPTRAQREEIELKAQKENRQRQEEILRKEKEELKRKQEELDKQDELERQNCQTPAGIELEEDARSDDEHPRTRINSSAEPERPQSRMQKGSRFQKPTQSQKPVRPTKDTSKVKPAPVSIKIGTASQRAAPSSSTLISALKSSFEPPQRPALPTSASQSSLHSVSSSTSSLRSESAQGGSSKQLKSLTAAANQLKKEQEEKERKAAAKRELERRRQENQRRQEDERRKQQAQLQKGRTTPGPASGRTTPGAGISAAKTVNRVTGVSNLRQKSEEPSDSRPDYKAASIYNKEPMAKTKRVLPQEVEEQPPNRHPTSRVGPQYQQEAAKKRRTNDYEDRHEMAPPVRNSVVKKELGLAKSVLPHGYAQALSQPTGSTGMRPLTKSGAAAALPQVEGVKFSKDKINFASNNATPGPSTFKTPATKAKAKTPATLKDSPLYPSGDSVELPDIPTDSEDEEDYRDDFKIPHWAESPELRALLKAQQTKNPEEVFGPMAKLDMEEIFANRSDRSAARFRPRSSSANWSGTDRLTQAEIQADQEARRKMMENGGWTYSGL